ncbi:MAG TPA: c-type cytochrome biogenesis protein CcmI, partial [Pyrinomonadaceae bacterium]|nr:c-type cytochrome biogenesis protein CcmI [Pyrinomonadaceae bacterium]
RNGITSSEQYQQDRDEIERRLLDDVGAAGTQKKSRSTSADRGPAYAIAAGVPLVAVILYLVLGNSGALSGQAPPTAAAESPQAPMTQQGIEANVAALAKRLEQNPNDLEGWTMLARSYLNLEKYNEASNAYARATALKADDANLLTEYAFVLAMTNNRQLAGQPRELITTALAVEPDNPKALELAGSAEFQAKNYKAAIEYWQKVLARSPADSELTKTLTERIKEAKSLADGGSK